MRNGTAVSVWLIFFQAFTIFAESSPSRVAEMNSQSRSSRRLVNIQRVTRNEEILTRQNNQPKDHGKDLVTNTNESFIATISDFSEPKAESFNITVLPTIEEESSPINLAAFNKVEQLAFPLDLDISSLPTSDSFGTSSFLNFLDESKSISDAENLTHHLGDSFIDPKVTESETEPFLTILVNSPPQVVTEPSKPDSSSVSPSDSVYVPLSYLHLRVPIPPKASAIAIAPPSLLPLEHVSPIPSYVGPPKNVEISSSAQSMNLSSVIPEKLSKTANLTVFPLNQSTSLIIDLKSPGQQVLTHNSDRQTFYQVLPPLFGIIYRVAPQTWIAPPSLNEQFQYDQSKFNLATATSYGTPHAIHPVYGNNHRQKFGSPPTLRALGFPPISNTRDNQRHEVNWARVGWTFRSTNFA